MNAQSVDNPLVGGALYRACVGIWHHRVDAAQEPDHTAKSSFSSRISQNRFSPYGLDASHHTDEIFFSSRISQNRFGPQDLV